MKFFPPLRLLPILIVLILTSALPARSQSCVSSNGRSANYDFVRLRIQASATHLAEGIRQGMNQWNNSSCVDGLTPYPYPRFDTLSTGGQAIIDIKFRDGFSSADQFEPACGVLDGLLDGSQATIYLYSKVREPNGSSHGCDLETIGVVSDLVAHELGHYLGLAESSCTNAIMGPAGFLINNGNAFYFTNRQVLHSE